VALSAERHAEVDALLREMELYLLAVAMETYIPGVDPNRGDTSPHIAKAIASQVATLRSILRDEQKQQQTRNQKQQR